MIQFFPLLDSFGTSIGFKQETMLYYRGDVGNTLYVIEEGSVELSVFDFNGDKMILTELCAGDFFGHVEIFTHSIRVTNASVSAGTCLKSFSAAKIKEFLQTNSHMALQVIESLCTTIESGVDVIEDHLTLNAFQKLAKKINELAQSRRTTQLFINQRKLSEFIGVSEKTINVSLNKLEERGAIKLHRGRITILDPILLRANYNFEKGRKYEDYLSCLAG